MLARTSSRWHAKCSGTQRSGASDKVESRTPRGPRRTTHFTTLLSITVGLLLLVGCLTVGTLLLVRT